MSISVDKSKYPWINRSFLRLNLPICGTLRMAFSYKTDLQLEIIDRLRTFQKSIKDNPNFIFNIIARHLCEIFPNGATYLPHSKI